MDAVADEIFIGVQIGHHHSQLVIRGPGQNVTLQHLVDHMDAALKILHVLLIVALQFDAHKHRDRQPIGPGIHIGAVAPDHTGGLKVLNPAQAGRGREVHRVRKVLIGHPTIGLKYADNLAIFGVHFAVHWQNLPT
ncbi:hypothetical protein SAMN05444385_102508 [Tritonibacter mobilis]|nr:hypothetical protein SAMN05444385_102508 [Tritonibacter mobilis]